MLGSVRDEAGAPLPGVAVSNGRDVVLSDVDGHFDLPRVTPFVTITRPTGYTSDNWWLPAIEDGGIAFTLRPHPQTLPFEFVHLTDTHLSMPAVDGLDFGLYREGSLAPEISEFLAELPLRAPDAQAVFITGDLVDNGLDVEYESFTDAIADSPLPLYLIPGNHDHMGGVAGSMISRNNYFTNIGTTATYEKHLGPRWYSFDIPGLHVVAMDWHSHETGLDHELQNAWLNADLAAHETGTPWLLLFHDQPGNSLLDHAPWPPIAAFSGHWHTSRVVDVDGTLHVNSPTTFFANLDFTPPAYRRVRWDGDSITLHTETRSASRTDGLGDINRATFAPTAPGASSAPVLWRSSLQGAGHRQRVSVDGELAFAGTQIEDEPRGYVESVDIATGATVWTTQLRAAVKTAPAIWNDTVVVADVSGDVHGLDRADGHIRWTAPSSDPLRRFAWNPATISEGVAYLGDQADLRAIDVATGAVIWRRTDIAPHHNLVQHAQPLIIGELLVMGFWPTPQHPVGLNKITGQSLWVVGEQDNDLFSALKALLIMGTAGYDPAEDAVLMPAFGHTARIDRATGDIAWVTQHPGAFSPATPLVTPAGYLVTASGHGLLMLEPATGSVLWEREISGNAPFPMRGYSKDPHPVIAAPTLIGDKLVLPGLDGLVRVLDLAGNLLGETPVGSPIAAELALAGDRLLAVGTDGTLLALSVTSLLGDSMATHREEA